MGLIKAAIGAVGGTLADSWKEMIYCDSMDSSVLLVKGSKRTSKRSSNTKGDENIITNGSVIAVNEGQCMLIVDQGKIVEVCAEPGEFTYDSSTEPSLFGGDFGENLSATFATIGKRIAFGGDTAHDQRVYYINTKEIIGNRYGTPNPVPFRVVDNNIGLDVDISVRCNGEYGYRIINPLLFYTNVAGNVDGAFEASKIESMLRSEILTALQPAFAKISEMGIRYSALPGHTMELSDALNEILCKKWRDLRGMVITSFGINSITASKEDEDMIKQLQRSAVMRNPDMAAASLVGAQGDAMRAAASNQGGAMMGFMGMNMAQQAGGMDANSLFQMSAMQKQQAAQQQAAAPAQGGWKCECGAQNTGKFCAQCGKPMPQNDAWQCECGAQNTGKFCQQCGKPKPQNDAWQCSCGAQNTGKFCAQCGKPKA